MQLRKTRGQGSSPFLLFPLTLVCTTRKSHFQLALIFESHVSRGGEKRKESQMGDTNTLSPILDHLATNMRSLTCSPRAKESLPDHTPNDLKASTRACFLKTLLRVELIPETDCFKPSKPKSHFLYSQCRLRRRSAFPQQKFLQLSQAPRYRFAGTFGRFSLLSNLAKDIRSLWSYRW